MVKSLYRFFWNLADKELEKSHKLLFTAIAGIHIDGAAGKKYELYSLYIISSLYSFIWLSNSYKQHLIAKNTLYYEFKTNCITYNRGIQHAQQYHVQDYIV